MTELTMEPCLLRTRLAGQPPGAILRCSGEIDLSNVDRLTQALATTIALGLPELEVDLREVGFLDSSALEALIQAQRELHRRGRRLCVRARPWAARLFQLVRLDDFLNVRTD